MAAINLHKDGFAWLSVAPVGIGEPLQLTMTPLDEVSGVVVDAAGVVVEGVSVHTTDERQARNSTQTDEHGRFKIPVARRQRSRYRSAARRSCAQDSGRKLPVAQACWE